MSGRRPDELEALVAEEGAGEALVASTVPAAPSPARRDALLASLRGDDRFAAYRRRVAELVDLDDAGTDALLAAARDPAGPGWRDDVVAGTRLYDFDGGPRVADAHCGIVAMEPGASYPRHRHLGDEWALVLQGGAVTDEGVEWAPGDLIQNPVGSVHAFRVNEGEPFVFVIVLYEGISRP